MFVELKGYVESEIIEGILAQIGYKPYHVTVLYETELCSPRGCGLVSMGKRGGERCESRILYARQNPQKKEMTWKEYQSLNIDTNAILLQGLLNLMTTPCKHV